METLLLSETPAVLPETPTEELVLQGTDDGRLVAIIHGERIPVMLRQCFPWSQPTRYLALWEGDEREVALVEDPASLTPASRKALEQALADAGFILQVTRVLSIEEEVEIRQWSVETRHGARTFQTHLDDWPRALPDGGQLIRDVGGDLYKLPAPGDLDAESRKELWAFID